MDVVLHTDRLVVRKFTGLDADEFHAYRNDPDVARFQGWDVPFPRELAVALVREFTGELWRRGEWTQVALATADAPDRIIGDVGVRFEADEPTVELGITVARTHQGQRYGAEALRAISDLMFADHGILRVVAFTHHENIPAQRSLAAADFTFTTTDGEDLMYLRGAV
jgi:RimJ/RimL family protein N-acetyltransferase